MKQDPRSIRIEAYSYDLPDQRIARYPLAQRDASKLLIYRQGQIRESLFSAIPDELPARSLLVFNDTRVIHARMLFKRSTGSTIELFCLEPAAQVDHQVAFAQTGRSVWKCMVGNAKRWKAGELLSKQVDGKFSFRVQAEMLGRENDLFLIAFTWQPVELSFAEVIHDAGTLPIPPYLNRKHEEEDETRYQTVYAVEQGSVAAPTAGLHFTEALLARLPQHQIHTAKLTLHVGAGTFKPVKSDSMRDHDMHTESVSIPLVVLEQLSSQLDANLPIVAVGTTVTRTLESLFWHGIKLMQGLAGPAMDIKQWEPYDLDPGDITASEALNTIIRDLKSRKADRLMGATQVILAPGYTFRLVNLLITNFHQPGNTLLLLVAAFAGDDWKRIYAYALEHDFRFLSYGDSSLLYRT